MSIERIDSEGSVKFRVRSKNGRNLGTFGTRSAAENRLREVEFFKHLSRKKKRLKSRRTGGTKRF